MTATEWLTCTDPLLMLEFLRGKASTRRLRHFAVAGFRRVPDHGRSGEWERAIEIGERLADGLASPAELPRLDPKGFMWDAPLEVRMLQFLVGPDPVRAAVQAVTWAAGWKRFFTGNDVYRRPEELPLHADLLRDVFGNPFQVLQVDACWLTWNDGTVVKLAQAIYDERMFDQLPVLGDALEDAGCTIADILDHCRHPELHIRGCWVLDLLLDKE